MRAPRPRPFARPLSCSWRARHARHAARTAARSCERVLCTVARQIVSSQKCTARDPSCTATAAAHSAAAAAAGKRSELAVPQARRSTADELHGRSGLRFRNEHRTLQLNVSSGSRAVRALHDNHVPLAQPCGAHGERRVEPPAARAQEASHPARHPSPRAVQVQQRVQRRADRHQEPHLAAGCVLNRKVDVPVWRRCRRRRRRCRRCCRCSSAAAAAARTGSAAAVSSLGSLAAACDRDRIGDDRNRSRPITQPSCQFKAPLTRRFIRRLRWRRRRRRWWRWWRCEAQALECRNVITCAEDATAGGQQRAWVAVHAQQQRGGARRVRRRGRCGERRRRDDAVRHRAHATRSRVVQRLHAYNSA
jgi:hypothetical protein